MYFYMDYFYLNPSVMMGLQKRMGRSEVNVLLLMMCYMSEKSSNVFINCKESREMFGLYGFSKTPERISAILSSMAKKGVLKREASGIYTLPDGLFKLVNK